ncbi:hypothetical protein ACIBHX_21115 [Nonomuraea sp. NPDC050536]|uniref:hypothetical protein n=1 Tax=Nonomuraea sp. NPDC050536 TaxID=3364366 RepID=UPI0037C69354
MSKLRTTHAADILALAMTGGLAITQATGASPAGATRTLRVSIAKQVHAGHNFRKARAVSSVNTWNGRSLRDCHRFHEGSGQGPEVVEPASL